MKANPRFRPFKLKNGMEWFILSVGKTEMDQFQADRHIMTANKTPIQLMKREYFDDPFFCAGDLVYNGVVIREQAD